MAVSPQATTIMFMPNSPSPPSGITSSGGSRQRDHATGSSRMLNGYRSIGDSQKSRFAPSRTRPRGEPPGRAEPDALRGGRRDRRIAWPARWDERVRDVKNSRKL